jgi:hypothetical protein
VIVTDQQVRRAMEELTRHGEIGKAAMRSGMDRKTARKYRDLGKLPSELKHPRTWRTRLDPFAQDWDEVRSILEDAPELEAKAVFEFLAGKHRGRYQEGQLRTFQRRVKQWRAQEGPPKEVFFPQEHRPGEAMQTDFTWATELGVTIGGELFEHMLCHPVLPYSNWEWATVCRSESMVAIRRGVQAAVFRLGRIPQWHQTDKSSAATHTLPGGKTKFNEEYSSLMRHLGMQPRTTGTGKKEQNGDVESSNGKLKKRLKQHLLLRGSRDFESVDQYEKWLWGVLDQANELRSTRLAEDLAAMRPLSVKRLAEWTKVDTRVSSQSTIRVKFNTYSVPSRLIGESVHIRIHDDRLEVFHGGVHQMTVERLLGRNGHRINYRHIIWWLVRKPGAFPRYRYREDLFPSLTFRRTYDALTDSMSERSADMEYLRLLFLAASTMESEVELALELLLDAETVPNSELVKALVKPDQPEAPELEELDVDLEQYDKVFDELGEVAS